MKITSKKNFSLQKYKNNSAKLDGMTALAQHSVECSENFDFHNAKIIHQETNLKKRLILESIEIKKLKSSVNKRTDIDNIHSSYFNVIEKSNCIPP